MFNTKTLTEQDIKLLKEKYPDTWEEKMKKVQNNYPVQYLIGNVDFLNTNILVNENVLIPRFETEYLVEKVLKKVDKYKEKKLKCLDICTGSGCIAISIAKNTNFLCTGMDISKEALKVAQDNMRLNQVLVKFLEHDILTEEIQENYDIIVSNPPYVAYTEEIDETTKYEPSIALYAENNGLLFYESILKKIKNKPKLIAFEIGEMQGTYIQDLAKNYFPTAEITIEKDLCGKDRYIFIEHK